LNKISDLDKTTEEKNYVVTKCA